MVMTHPAARGDSSDAGEYQLLHQYLRDRFADRVVLTFEQIEDLLGFPLPESARHERAWWGGAGPTGAQSEAWMLAGRTATVNLPARSVLFEREDEPATRAGRR